MPQTIYRGVPRDTITGHDGREVDITEQIDQVLRIADSENFRTQYRVDFIESFGRKLIAAAGWNAPQRVIEDYADDMGNPEFVAFLREKWHAIAMVCE